MELNDLEQAIQECMDGELQFNNGENLHCFLYQNTWYPLRVVVNRALSLANEPDDLTTHNALVRLFDVLPYVRFQTVVVQNQHLKSLDNQEKLNEILTLSEMIRHTTAT